MTNSPLSTDHSLPDSELHRPSSWPNNWEVGSTVHDLYEIQHELSKDEKTGRPKGSMGKVYLVYHKNWNRNLAVKIPKFARGTDHQKFKKEAELWVDLGLHPNIVSCYYVRLLDGIPCVFIEYVDEGSVSDWIRERKLYKGKHRQVLERMLNIAIQFAWGLDYAHMQGLVHRDVKPANVMLTSDCTAKVTDFGLAKARMMAGEKFHSEDDGSIFAVKGGMTPAYCSPEQAAGKKLSGKTDIWSWALSILEMFAGRRCWTREGVEIPGPLARQGLEDFLDAPPRDSSIPSMPAQLAELLRQCFLTNPNDRPADFSEIATKLQQIYELEINKSYPLKKPEAAELLADSKNNQAVSWVDLGELEKSEQLWREALEADPHHLGATYNLGVTRWRRGELTDSQLIHKLEALRLSYARSSEIDYLTATVHLERGDVDSAITLLERAERLAPTQTEIATAIEVARSQRPARCLRTLAGHTDWVGSVSLSANGRTALSGSSDTTLRLWDTETGRCLKIFDGHQGSVNSVQLSRNGDLALSGSNDRTVRLWDVQTGRCIRVFEGHSDAVLSVCLSADEKWALSGSKDRAIILWEIASGSGKILGKHDGWVSTVCMSANGYLAISGGGGDFSILEQRYRQGLKQIYARSEADLHKDLNGGDYSVRAWNIRDGTCLWTASEHLGPVCSVSLDENRQLVLSGSMDRTLKLWKLADGECLHTFKGHSKAVGAACFSTDGQLALSGSMDHTLKLWEIATYSCVCTLEGHTDEINSVAISTDDRLALSASNDKTIKLWQLPTRLTGYCNPYLSRLWASKELIENSKKVQNLLLKSEEFLKAGAFLKAFEAANEARTTPGYERAPQVVALWAKLSLFCRRLGFKGARRLQTLNGHDNAVRSVCFSIDGRHALSSSMDGTLRMWEVKSGKLEKILGRHDGWVTSVCFSSDGQLALSGSTDRTLCLWDTATGNCLRVFKGHQNDVNSVCFSADERWVLSASRDSTVRLWEKDSGRCIRIFKGHRGSVFSVSISPDNRFVFSGGMGTTVRVWDIETGKCIQSVRAHAEAVNAICVSADGFLVVSGGDDGTVSLCEVTTQGHLRPIRTFKAHDFAVNSVGLTADARFALTASHDNTLKLWDITTGDLVHTFEGHTAWVASGYFSADGRWILSGSGDNTIRLWELDWDLEAVDMTDWSEGALPYLIAFLSRHIPYSSELLDEAALSESRSLLQNLIVRVKQLIIPNDKSPKLKGQSSLAREGKPSWTEVDFEQLIHQLQFSGYGWLNPKGVRRKLEEILAQAESSMQPDTGDAPTETRVRYAEDNIEWKTSKILDQAIAVTGLNGLRFRLQDVSSEHLRTTLKLRFEPLDPVPPDKALNARLALQCVVGLTFPDLVSSIKDFTVMVRSDDGRPKLYVVDLGPGVPIAMYWINYGNDHFGPLLAWNEPPMFPNHEDPDGWYVYIFIPPDPLNLSEYNRLLGIQPKLTPYLKTAFEALKSKFIIFY